MPSAAELLKSGHARRRSQDEQGYQIRHAEAPVSRLPVARQRGAGASDHRGEFGRNVDGDEME